MTDLKRPEKPEKCPECGATGTQRDDHYRQTPPPATVALNTRLQIWSCGHTSKQWWFQRFEDDILAAGIGEPPATTPKAVLEAD